MHITKERFTLPLFALIFTLLIGACTDPDPTVVRDFNDIRQTFSELDIQPGINDFTIEAYTDIFWSFRIIAPQNTTGTGKSCVIALHDEPTEVMGAHQNTDCYAEPGLSDLDGYIISPNGGSQKWDDFSNQELVVGLIRLAREYLPVDTNKFMVMGFGDGGNGAWYFAENYPDFAKTAMPIASFYPTDSESGGYRVFEVPVYCIHGTMDDLYTISQIRTWVNGTAIAGSNVRLEEATDLGHDDPCNYVPFIQNGAQFIRDSIWN
ncbi:MAG: dienelactone hydrolase family protein [Saprospiraceae bacterium]|nr:dienelactone hydrolase family protein [Saprospiraceae bacterium]